MRTAQAEGGQSLSQKRFYEGFGYCSEKWKADDSTVCIPGGCKRVIASGETSEDDVVKTHVNLINQCYPMSFIFKNVRNNEGLNNAVTLRVKGEDRFKKAR